MSAQTTDIQVNKVNKVFFKKLIKPEDWIKLWVAQIKKYINTISFFNNKANNIFKTCKILVKKKLKTFDTLEKLITLHWVWIKTAKVFLAITKDAPYLAVDTHVHRVLNRVWIVNTNTPEKTDKLSEKIFTKQNLADLHHSLIFFWRYHCMAIRKPKCKKCPLIKECSYQEKNI
jgi:endonuclease-3